MVFHFCCLAFSGFIYLLVYCSDQTLASGLRLAKIKEWVDAHDPGAMVIPLSGAVEAKLQEMEEEESTKYCEEQKTQRSD